MGRVRRKSDLNVEVKACLTCHYAKVDSEDAHYYVYVVDYDGRQPREVIVWSEEDGQVSAMSEESLAEAGETPAQLARLACAAVAARFPGLAR